MLRTHVCWSGMWFWLMFWSDLDADFAYDMLWTCVGCSWIWFWFWFRFWFDAGSTSAMLRMHVGCSGIGAMRCLRWIWCMQVVVGFNIRRYSWPRWSRGRTSLRRALWLIMFTCWFWVAAQARLVIQRVVWRQLCSYLLFCTGKSGHTRRFKQVQGVQRLQVLLSRPEHMSFDFFFSFFFSGGCWCSCLLLWFPFSAIACHVWNERERER